MIQPATENQRLQLSQSPEAQRHFGKGASACLHWGLLHPASSAGRSSATENGISRQDDVSSRPVRAIPCWRRRKNTRLSRKQFLFSLRISFTSLDPFLASLKQGERFLSFCISFFTAVPGCARIAETPKYTSLIFFLSHKQR